jgi:hypothetical protein
MTYSLNIRNKVHDFRGVFFFNYVVSKFCSLRILAMYSNKKVMRICVLGLVQVMKRVSIHMHLQMQGKKLKSLIQVVVTRSNLPLPTLD